MNILLTNNWTMKKIGDSTEYQCSVPCSVYKTLIENNVIPDPYYRENEYISTQICDDDYSFSTSFFVPKEFLHTDRIYLTFEGIDTISDISLNGSFLGHTDNMHRIWEYDVTALLNEGENKLEVNIKSPNRYVAQMDKKRHLWGVDTTMAGYTHLRKAHCMFGWDWGPILPDMGIWRPCTLSSYSGGRIKNVYYSQEHSENKVLLSCEADIEVFSGNCEAVLEITDPQGKIICTQPLTDGKCQVTIKSPQLWWVNGLGEQPLYNCTVKLLSNGEVCDKKADRIGLRTLTISRDKDEWGEEFCFINNGVKFFAMGGNYIPEDQIVSRCTEEKTRRLLDNCKKANFNFIRVWGGGYYPDSYFYDWCDENGIIVWQDFMFACSAYLLTDDFRSTVEEEVKDNIIRLRNHPSLGLWCGNNEIESAWEYWGLPEDKQAQADYLVLFEDIIPKLLKQYDKNENTFYWPSSPSSGGGFKDASSNHAGDMHYWDVWHNFKPIEAFKEFYYRFCSEYGFESLPNIKTCRQFADESKGDFDLCSPVMEAHQKCVQGNEKVMYYLAQMVRYPYDFRRLIYSSQLVQSDCIRSNVEHMRRARGRCMGSAYWQINDSNPVISWSSIDYYGRWKGLHYCAKRFYAPCLLSVDDKNMTKPVFNISNERPKPFDGILNWTLRSNKAEILESGSAEVHADAFSAKDVLTIDLSQQLAGRYDKREKYLEYSISENGEILSAGSTLFVRPKEFHFLVPEIKTEITEQEDRFEIVLTAKYYAKSVCLDLKKDDCIFSDNWFDIHGEKPVKIYVLKKDISAPLTKSELSEQLEIMYN